MDRDEDFPSDSEQSDDDYKPEELEEAASENESGDDQQLSDEEKSNPTATLKDQTKFDDIEDTTTEKDKSDALWADFLSDTNVPEKPSAGARVVSTESIPPRNEITAKQDASKGDKEQVLLKHDTIVREKVGVAKILDVLARPGKLPRSIPSGISTFSNSKRPAGLSSVLGQIGKKAKLSTLEKTKLDWNSFKKSEGIDEQLTTHNKGKEGYLERQDFFQRTDLRQFEIEKQLRQTKRTNR